MTQNKSGPKRADGVYPFNKASSIVKKGKDMTTSTRFLGALLCLLVSLSGCSSESTEITETNRQTATSDSQSQGSVANRQEMMNLFVAKETSGKVTPASPKTVSLPLPYNTVNLVENLAQPLRSASSPDSLQLVVGFAPTGQLYYDFEPASDREATLPTFESVVATDQR